MIIFYNFFTLYMTTISSVLLGFFFFVSNYYPVYPHYVGVYCILNALLCFNHIGAHFYEIVANWCAIHLR